MDDCEWEQDYVFNSDDEFFMDESDDGDDDGDYHDPGSDGTHPFIFIQAMSLF